MSDVLHHARLTPTQQAAISHQTKFRASIEARAGALKTRPVVVPISAVEQPVAVPVQIRMTAGDIAARIAQVTEELKELRRANAGLVRREFAELNGYPTVKEIQRVVCSYYSISMIDIQSHRRYLSMVVPRQVAMYLARTMTMLSSPQVARKFGQRDHTTVLHAVRKISEDIKTDSKLAGEIAAIKLAIVPLRPACSEPIEGTPCNSAQTTT